MANKNFVIGDGLNVTVYKRRTSRNLRLSVNVHGQVRVTIPAWAPYRAGLEFAEKRQAWIREQKRVPSLGEDAIRQMRKRAEELLPSRLASLADRHGFDYSSVKIKKLKSRWGSCDQYQNIALSLFLMQLPTDLIDYVLLHELVHTRVLKHGPDFWHAMERVLPEAKAHRKRLRDYRPAMA